MVFIELLFDVDNHSYASPHPRPGQDPREELASFRDLFHHGHHRLPARKLRALTTVHNDFNGSPDGATAAERFFEADDGEVFDDFTLERSHPGADQ